MTRESIDDDLQRLIDARPTLSEILVASPFDANKNIDQRVTQDLFFGQLFVDSPGFARLAAKLNEAWEDPYENIRVLILDGFSGSGKTTFLRHYARTSSHIKTLHIDFHSMGRSVEPRSTGVLANRRRLAKALALIEKELESSRVTLRENLEQVKSLIEGAKVEENPLVAVIKSYLASLKDDALVDCIGFLREKQRELAPYLSRNLIERIGVIGKEDLGSAAHLVLNACNFGDTFIVLLLLCFRGVEKRKLNLLVFDNLDAVEMDYLSDYFQRGFIDVLSVATSLAQDRRVFSEPIDFSRRFKFIFSLRDANGAVLNAHIADSMGHRPRYLSLRVRFDGELYTKMLIRRLEFYDAYLAEKRVYGEKGAKELISLLRGMVDEKYFRRVALPLFNSDYRKLAMALFEVAKRAGSFRRLVFRGGRVGDEIGSFERFGRGGAVLHGLLAFLRRDNFLGEYPFIDVRIDPVEGYCAHSRMVLNFVLNRSGLARSADITVPEPGFSPLSLSEVVKAVGPVYTAEEVVKVLVTSFLFHEKNWAHLVTFRNCPVVSEQAFQEEVAELAGTGGEIDAAFEALEAVELTLNPAGFVYLKNVLPHFEFYSVLAGNTVALFSVGLEKAGGRFKFEDLIRKVLRLVTRHVLSMRTFFERRLGGELGMSPHDYQESDLSFKYSGQGAPKARGQFHSTRIITAHVDYLDNYRFFLLGKLLGSELDVVAASVNEKLVRIIEQYSGLLDLSNDEAAAAFRKRFRERIQRIKSAEYDDFQTSISELKIEVTD